jgi:short-subunit dehydrogenase
MQRRLCLITGASAGIGAALARIYAEHGWDLVLTARREERLQALASELQTRFGAQCMTIQADLVDPGTPDRIVRHIEAQGRPLDGLVNNAGYGGPHGLAAADWRQHADFIQVMVTAPTHLSRLVLPGMMARSYGRILNVASIAGMLPPVRGQSLYGAAKAFMIEATRAMHLEARGAGIHVTALCPGLTRTEFHAVAGMQGAADGLPGMLWQGADTVARAGYFACEANAPVRIPGLLNKAAVSIFRALPRRLGMALMATATGRWEGRN